MGMSGATVRTLTADETVPSTVSVLDDPALPRRPGTSAGGVTRP